MDLRPNWRYPDDSVKIELDGHVYEGPEPSGSEGMRLYSFVQHSMVELGYADVTDVVHDSGSIARLVAMPRAVAASPFATELFCQTFKGWKRDDINISKETLNLYKVGEFHEPWLAMQKVWISAGFFRAHKLPGQD